jgi:hypothetical protein
MNAENVIAFWQSVISSTLIMQKENGAGRIALLIGSISLLFNFVLLCVFFNIAKRYKNQYKKEKLYRTGIKILKGEFPTKYGCLIKKEIKDRFHLLDLYVVMVLSIYYGSYLIAEKNISRFSFYFYVSLTLALVFNSFFNIFGSETVNGIERYKLLPIKGKELLLLKNGIIFTIYTISVFPNMVLYSIRCGGKHLLFGILGYLLQMFLYFMFGNRISIKYPRRNSEFKMSSMTSINYVPNSLLGLAIIIVSNVLLLNMERIEPFWGIVAVLLLASFVLFAYRCLIEVQGKSLEYCIRFDKTYCVFETGLKGKQL